MNLPAETTRFCFESLRLSGPEGLTISPLSQGGSDRVFCRVRGKAEESAVLIHYDPRRRENAFYAEIAAFLREIAVPVPRIIRHDPQACLLLLEDLGDLDLWSFREASWEVRRSLYRKTLRAVQKLHSFPESGFPRGRVRLMEDFGPELYRWEREYFREHFVAGFCGVNLEPSFERELEDELAALAERLCRAERRLVHRDLQSRNVMIRGGEPVFIDFQGMRFGNVFYDLGSLLCDPYVSLSEGEREELLRHYFELEPGPPAWPVFRTRFFEASAQRLMQALGAFGFLGLRKNLADFLRYIPPGIENLRLAAAQASSLPLLQELARSCRQAMPKK